MSELNILLQEKGLLIPYGQGEWDLIFTFDLNQSGCIRIKGDPENVLLVVNIARDIAESEGYGEHNAILGLVVERRELIGPGVFWFRRHHLHNPNAKTLVSVREWLSERGYPYLQRETE